MRKVLKPAMLQRDPGPPESTCNCREREKYPNQQFHDDGVSLCSSHVQWRPVHFGASVSANPSSQQDISSGVMTMLGREVEGGRSQLQTDEHTGDRIKTPTTLK